MNLQWDPKIGTAAVVGVIGSLSVLVMVGVTWGSMTSKIDIAAVIAAEAKTAALEVSRSGALRDIRVSEQSERLGKIETSITFIVPSLARIEAKLDAGK